MSSVSPGSSDPSGALTGAPKVLQLLQGTGTAPGTCDRGQDGSWDGTRMGEMANKMALTVIP